MGDFTKKKRLFAGFRKISSEVQKSSCIVHRCTVYDLIAKKEAGYRRNVGRSRSGDISCRKKDVSCSSLRDFFSFALLIVLLLVKPSGLFGVDVQDKA